MFAHQIHEALATSYVQQLIQAKARQIVRRRRMFTASERPDLEQELTIHVVRRAHLFDPARGSVNTFIARVVDSAVAMILRERKRFKHAIARDACSLEEEVRHDDTVVGTLGELLNESDGCRRTGGEVADERGRIDLQADTRQLLSDLPPWVQKVAMCLSETPHEATASRAMGLSRRQIRRAMDMIRSRFRTSGFSEI